MNRPFFVVKPLLNPICRIKHEPLSSGDLVKLCAEELGWKKSTAYTILRRICERGLFQNQKGTVAWKLDENTQFIFIDWGEDFVQSNTVPVLRPDNVLVLCAACRPFLFHRKHSCTVRSKNQYEKAAIQILCFKRLMKFLSAFILTLILFML